MVCIGRDRPWAGQWCLWVLGLTKIWGLRKEEGERRDRGRQSVQEGSTLYLVTGKVQV